MAMQHDKQFKLDAIRYYQDIYLEVSEKTEAAQKAGRRFSVSGMLKFLGVSRSGYHAWLHRVPSDTEKHRESVKEKIQDIYDDSKQNYGAPKSL